MDIALVAYEGLNELDVFANLHVLGRVSRVNPNADLRVHLVAHKPELRSMYGVSLARHQPLAFASTADAVLISSGNTRQALEDPSFLSELRLDPRRQLIGSQCSGALVLQRLGLLGAAPACTDHTTRPWLEATGVRVLDQAFIAHDNVATAGGCFAAAYLATWMIWRLLDRATAERTLAAVAPVGEEADMVARVSSAIERYLPRTLEPNAETASPMISG